LGPRRVFVLDGLNASRRASHRRPADFLRRLRLLPPERTNHPRHFLFLLDRRTNAIDIPADRVVGEEIELAYLMDNHRARILNSDGIPTFRSQTDLLTISSPHPATPPAAVAAQISLQLATVEENGAADAE
jgi:hypothetical protein